MHPTLLVFIDYVYSLQLPAYPYVHGPETPADLPWHLHYNEHWPHTWLGALAEVLRDDPIVAALAAELSEHGETTEARVRNCAWEATGDGVYNELRRMTYPLYQRLTGEDRPPSEEEDGRPVDPGRRAEPF